MPARATGYACTIGVDFLMTTLTVQRGYAYVPRAADDIREMAMAVIALLRIVCSCVTVDAAR
jgi:hypothetical protein